MPGSSYYETGFTTVFGQPKNQAVGLRSDPYNKEANRVSELYPKVTKSKQYFVYFFEHEGKGCFVVREIDQGPRTRDFCPVSKGDLLVSLVCVLVSPAGGRVSPGEVLISPPHLKKT